MRSHAALAELAEVQHGVVAYRQLRGLGFSKGAIDRSSGASRLLRVHRGVYAVGRGGLSRHGSCMTAVLACGERAKLSHASAAWLWGILTGFPHEPEVIVSGGGHRRGGIRVHRAARLALEEHGTIERIPVTSLPRTLLDLAAVGPTRRLQQAVEQSERRGTLDIGQIDALLRLRPSSRGAAPLRLALEIYRDPVFSRARSERLFLDLVKQAGLPRPAINTFVAGHEIDAYWEAERFAVEVDGWDAHRSRAAFESDPLRLEDLKLAGIDAIRITARRIERQPRQVGQRLGLLLARRRRELGP